MFQLIQFPPKALDDVRALVQLTTKQLGRFAELLNSADAVPPVDSGFGAYVAESLKVDIGVAESISHLALLMQEAGIDSEDAEKIVQDFEELVRTTNPDDLNELLKCIDQKRKQLVDVVRRQPAITRELLKREVASGPEPVIDSVRAIVHLRPLFERSEDGSLVDIDCLVPAISIEFQCEQNGESHLAAYSLNKETLDELIEALKDAQAQWEFLQEKYSDEICD